MFAKKILDSSVSDAEKVKLLEAKNQQGKPWLFGALSREDQQEDVGIFLDFILASTLPLKSKQEVLSAKYGNLSWLQWAVDANCLLPIHNYVVQVYRHGFNFADDEAKLVRAAAEKALKKSQNFSWEQIIHWIGISYQPSSFKNHKKHTQLAEAMKIRGAGLEAEESVEESMRYLHHIYHHELENKKTKLAQAIELAFANIGNLEALLSNPGILDLQVNSINVAGSGIFLALWETVNSIGLMYSKSVIHPDSAAVRVAIDMCARAVQKRGDPKVYLECLDRFLCSQFIASQIIGNIQELIKKIKTGCIVNQDQTLVFFEQRVNKESTNKESDKEEPSTVIDLHNEL